LEKFNLEKFESWSEPLHAELHSRPSPILESPSRILYFCISNGGQFRDTIRREFDENEKDLFTNRDIHDVRIFEDEKVRAQYVFHNEYIGLTLIFKNTVFKNIFDRTDLSETILYWKSKCQGKLITSIDFAFVEPSEDEYNRESLVPVLGDHQIVGAKLADGYLKVWNTFVQDREGYIRVILEDCHSRVRRNGRVLHRLIDIETYRILSLKGLPIAREVIPKVRQLDDQLKVFIDQLNQSEAVEDDKLMLDRLMKLSVETESIRSNYTGVYSAVEAYQHILRCRLDELRETRIEGFQMYHEFLLRRMDPGFKTCESLNERIQMLSSRLATATNLLRAKVNVHMETQNQNLLKSFDERSAFQLKLQQTVEGISIIALAYYGLGLLKIILKGMKSAGLPLNPDIAVFLLAPVLVYAIWKYAHKLSVYMGEKH